MANQNNIQVFITCIILLTQAYLSVCECRRGFIEIGPLCYKFERSRQFEHADASKVCLSHQSQLARVTNENYQDITTWIRRYGFTMHNYWIKNPVPSLSSSSSVLSSNCSILSYRHSFNKSAAPCEERHLFICSHSSLPRVSAGARSDQFSCARKYGYYPHSSICTKYILCFKGKKFVYSCTHGEMFDPNVNRCIRGSCNPPTSAPDVVGPGSNEHLSCDIGYVKYLTKCYKLFHSFLQWEFAKQSCQQNGGQLASIQSRAILEFLHQNIDQAEQNHIDYWIGLKYDPDDRSYKWNNGATRVDQGVQDWAVSSNRLQLLKQCVKLAAFFDYKWISAVCAEQNGYICEKDAQSTHNRSSQPIWKAANTDCGRRRTLGQPHLQPIVGGQDAPGGDHVWVVSLRTRGRHKCGATLIDRCWLLTAAHCVTAPSVAPNDVPTEAVFGDFDRMLDEDTEQSIGIDSIVVHPGFAAYPVPTNDIALIKLQECTDQTKPICLADNDDQVRSVLHCQVVGYGAVNAQSDVYAKKLQVATVPFIDHQRCKSLYNSSGSQQSLVTNTMLCAGYLEGGIDSCRGDSGGALSCVDVLTEAVVQIGIVSWGQGCAARNKPGVYTRLSAFHQWIRNTTRITF